MIGFFLLWMGATLSILTMMVEYFIRWNSLSLLFFPLLPLVFLPVVMKLLAFIRSEQEKDDILPPSLPLISILLLVAFLSLSFFHPSAIGWLMLVFGVAGILSLLESRILFTFALLFLSMVVVLLIVEQKAPAEALSIQLYYALVLGVLSEIVSPWVRSMVRRFPKILSSPDWWKLYLDEIRQVLHETLRIFPYAYGVLLFFVISEIPLWKVQFHRDILFLFDVVVYGILFLTPYRWSWKKIIPAFLDMIYATRTLTRTIMTRITGIK